MLMLIRVISFPLSCVLLLLCVSCFSGCTLFKETAPELDLSGYVVASRQEVKLIRQHVLKASESPLGFRDLVKMNITRDGFSVASELVVVFERPDKLRIEFLLPGIQQSDTILRSTDGSIDVFVPSERVILHGDASVGEVYRLLGVALDVSELMSWIVGRAPIWASAEIARDAVLVNRALGSIIYQVELNDGRIVVAGYSCEIIDNKSGDNGVGNLDTACAPSSLLRFFEVSEKGHNRRLFFSEFSGNIVSESGVSAPAKVSLWLPERDILGEMQFTKPVIHNTKGKIPEKVFHPKFPSNLPVVDIQSVKGNAVLYRSNF